MTAMTTATMGVGKLLAARCGDGFIHEGVEDLMTETTSTPMIAFPRVLSLGVETTSSRWGSRNVMMATRLMGMPA